MNKKPTQTAQTRAVKLRLAALLIIFLVFATLPYIWLIEHFGYDDILREPPSTILTKFHAGGPPLVLAWFAFAMSALFFSAVVDGFNKLFLSVGGGDHIASILGIASSLAQTIGLLRWVLVVPGLAATFVAPGTSQAMQEAIIIVFEAVHGYGGMVLGEMIGQLLLAAWTARVSWRLYQAAITPRWLSVIGLLTVPLWLIGQTELLHYVVPAIPTIEVIPFAFMGWEAWLGALAIAFAVSAWKERA